ncbi:MAG: hypothetical protein ACT4OO_13995, partial [Nitrospiraceae bacterium]
FLFAVLVLIGGLVSSVDVDHLEQILASGQIPTNLGLLSLLTLCLLALALWSIADAVRVARRR